MDTKKNRSVYPDRNFYSMSDIETYISHTLIENSYSYIASCDDLYSISHSLFFSTISTFIFSIILL